MNFGLAQFPPRTVFLPSSALRISAFQMIFTAEEITGSFLRRMSFFFLLPNLLHPSHWFLQSHTQLNTRGNVLCCLFPISKSLPRASVLVQASHLSFHHRTFLYIRKPLAISLRFIVIFLKIYFSSKAIPFKKKLSGETSLPYSSKKRNS